MFKRGARIWYWAALTAIFGKLCNLHPNVDMFYYVGVAFALLTGIELLLWIGYKLNS